MGMKDVLVYFPTGRTREFHVTDVADLRLQIYDFTGVAPCVQRLRSGGRLLTTISQHGRVDLDMQVCGGMPPKTSKKGRGKKEEPPKTEFSEMDIPECKDWQNACKVDIKSLKKQRNYAQLDVDHLQTIYDIVLKESATVEVQIRNVESEMEIMKNNFHNEKQMFKQKVKETDYNHENTLKAMQYSHEVAMETSATEHQKKMADLHVKKAAIQKGGTKSNGAKYGGLEQRQLKNQQEVDQLRETYRKELSQLEAKFQKHHDELEEAFAARLKQTERDFDLRQRMELMEIEELKNMHVRDLLQNHNHAFGEMRQYYQDITRDNLNMITALKEELDELRTRIGKHKHKYKEIIEENKKLSEPLGKAKAEFEKLERQLMNYEKTKRALKSAQGRLQGLNDEVSSRRDLKTKMEKELELAETNHNQLTSDLESTVRTFRARCAKNSKGLQDHAEDVHNKLADMIERFQEVVEQKEVDGVVLKEVQTRIDELIDVKNEEIENARYKVSKITKQHDDLVRIYESKLLEIGIPEEELGLKTIDAQGNTIPTQLSLE